MKKNENKSADNTNAWITQLWKAYNGENIMCPACGKQAVSKFYVFDDGVGFGDFICENCGANHHLCRLKYPENIKISPEFIPNEG